MRTEKQELAYQRQKDSRAFRYNLRDKLKPMSIKERIAYLDHSWDDYFNNMVCPKWIKELLTDDVIELFHKGYSMGDINNKLGITPLVARSILKEHGVSKRQNPLRVLTKEQVFEILDNPNGGASWVSVQYGVSSRVIQKIRDGITYQDWCEEYNQTILGQDDDSNSPT